MDDDSTAFEDGPHRSDAVMDESSQGPLRLAAPCLGSASGPTYYPSYGSALVDDVKARSHGLAAALVLALVACGDATGPEACSVPEECVYAAELGVDLSQMTKTASGLYWQDLQVGHGVVVDTGTFVLFHSIGWLPDGTVIGDTHQIDPTCYCAPALADTVGVGHLIPGWEEGFLGMQLGTIRLMVIPPQLAYGAAGYGETVPPNSVLISQIEVLSLTAPE